MARYKSIFGSPVASPVSTDEDTSSNGDVVTVPTKYHQPAKLQVPDSDQELDDIEAESEYDEDESEEDDEKESDEYDQDHASHEFRPWQSKITNASQRSKWMALTAKDRAASDTVTHTESNNLTTQILNIHGITAKQYGTKLSDLGEPGWSSKNTQFDRFRPRADWEKLSWKPRIAWDRWPLRPFTVPRKQTQVWASSLVKSEAWTPSGELEQNIFAFFLRTAHTQWLRRASARSSEFEDKSAPSTRRNEIKPELDLSDGADSESGPGTCENNQKKTKSQSEHPGKRNDQPVFSADDGRSWRILKPSVRSTISTLDKVLISLYKSQKGSVNTGSHSGKLSHKEALVRDPETINILSPVDWSHVLGMAAIAGVSPQVISRAATRCSAALHERMAFNLLREEDFTHSLKPPTIFMPDDFGRHEPDERLAIPPADWSPQDGCPYTDCKWYGSRVAPGNKVVESQNWKLFMHLEGHHGWYDGRPRNIEDATGMIGGVHIDGFLQPIVPAGGWRGQGTGPRAKSVKQNKETSCEPSSPG